MLDTQTASAAIQSCALMVATLLEDGPSNRGACDEVEECCTGSCRDTRYDCFWPGVRRHKTSYNGGVCCRPEDCDGY